MVVVLSAIAILYMMAEQRVNDLPSAAERASFQGVLEQLRTGVNLAMISRLADSRRGDPRMMARTNPVLYMADGPSNYLGELDLVTDALRRRNAWYFETSSGELVYLVGGNSVAAVWVTVAGVPVNLGQLRFRIENLYDDGNGGVTTGTQLGTNEHSDAWEGVQLMPVHQYRWDATVDLNFEQ